MLKTRMGVPATPLPAVPAATAHPEIALDAVGPVLETVLANLTSEYERRLLAKDQEHKGQAAAVEALRRQLAALQEEAAHWRHAAESRAAEEAAEAIAKTESEKTRATHPFDGK